MEKIEAYLKQVDVHCQQAEEELKKGDLRQAGEKYWGAASQAVKAFAEKKGWRQGGHVLLFQDIARIAEEYKDEEIRGLFHRAHILHINFYEGWLSKKDIESNAKDVKKFVNKIKAIINNGK